jgi:propanol-preferring alcohol dehydrogenase
MSMKMLAQVLNKPALVEDEPLSLEQIPLPEPGPGQVRIRVKVCGVCRTDLHTVEGELDLPRLPLIPGHQIVGRIDALGQGVTSLKQGDRVGVPWLNSTCGKCSYCKKGLENLCEKARFTGLHEHGGYAQYALAPADFVCPLPQGYPDFQVAPLLCAGIIGFRALRLSEIKPGERLGLFGFGASAHIAIQVARYFGCEVFVFTRSENHRRLARELGAAWVGGIEDSTPALLDSAVIFAPAGAMVPAALKFLRPAGTLSINAVYMDTIPEMDYNELLYKERTIRSVANSTRKDAKELLDLAPKVPIHTEVQVFPLKKANQVLQMLKQSKIKAAAVLEIPQD